MNLTKKLSAFQEGICSPYQRLVSLCGNQKQYQQPIIVDVRYLVPLVYLAYWGLMRVNRQTIELTGKKGELMHRPAIATELADHWQSHSN
jgi:hypothetical protein